MTADTHSMIFGMSCSRSEVAAALLDLAVHLGRDLDVRDIHIRLDPRTQRAERVVPLRAGPLAVVPLFGRAP